MTILRRSLAPERDEAATQLREQVRALSHPLERPDDYVPTVLPLRYDAFLYLDQTRALHPLHVPARDRREPPETYPWNV